MDEDDSRGVLRNWGDSQELQRKSGGHLCSARICGLGGEKRRDLVDERGPEPGYDEAQEEGYQEADGGEHSYEAIWQSR